MLIVISMVFPLVQLVDARLRVRRQRQAPQGGRSSIRISGVPAVRVRELARRRGRRRGHVRHRSSTPTRAARSTDLRNGRVNGVLTIPPEFSRRVLAKNEPRVALIEDNTDNFVSATLVGTIGQPRVGAFNQPADAPRVSGRDAARRGRGLPVRAVRPVPAAGIHRDVDLHDGDDRRRHHLHRRQGARAARGLSGDADHQARADRRLQHLGHDQGRAGRHARS